MASLREIQRTFLNAVLFDETDAFAEHVLPNGMDPERRVAIYRNNSRETFASVLAATFPVLERLAGPAWLRQTGREYQQRYPSRCGNLHYVGRHLAAYLERRLSGTRYDYFADVARLEWAYQEVLVAADHAPLDPARLQSVPEQQHGRLVLELAPAARLVESRWPLLAIWRANRPETATEIDSSTLDLSDGPSRLLVLRREDHVQLRELPADDFEFLSACARGSSLAQIVAELADPSLLPELLVRCVAGGALVGFHLAPDTPDTLAET